ncbi:extracellular calcium-sensing receptor-like [Lissotriton helveticus]
MRSEVWQSGSELGPAASEVKVEPGDDGFALSTVWKLVHQMVKAIERKTVSEPSLTISALLQLNPVAAAHDVDTGDSLPVNYKSYRLSDKAQSHFQAVLKIIPYSPQVLCMGMDLTHLVVIMHLWKTISAAAVVGRSTRCGLFTPRMESYSKEGDVIFGILAAVHQETVIPSAKSLFTEPSAPRSCKRINPKYYQSISAMVFAINEINASPHLLPNNTLGFQIYDSCSSEAGAIGGTLQQLSGGKETTPNYFCHFSPKLAGFIGDGPTAEALPMARILGISLFPQISYAAGLPMLSDKIQFPSFLRTVGSASLQAEALVQLLLHYRWTWIGILFSDNDLGLQGSHMFKEEAAKNGICIEFFETLPTQAKRSPLAYVTNIIQTSSSNVIVCFASSKDITLVLKEISLQGITRKIWLGTTSWFTSTVFSQRSLWKTLNGTLGMIVQGGEILEFKEFLYNLDPLKNSKDIFIKTFWEQVFNCKLVDVFNETNGENMTVVNGFCSGAEKLESLDASVFEVKDFTIPYYAYKAIYALAMALHDLLHCNHQEGPFTNKACADPKDFQPWQMLHYVKNVRKRSSDGSGFLFDSSGDSAPLYDLLYWHTTSSDTSSFLKVGIYNGRASTGLRLVVNESIIFWGGKYHGVPLSVCSDSCAPGYRRSAMRGRPACCFFCVPCPDGSISNQTDALECMKCPDGQWSFSDKVQCVPKVIDFLSYKEPLGFILSLISVFLFLNATGSLCIFIRYRHTPVVRANNLHLSYILLVALMPCFLCSLVFIGRPNRVTCMLRQVIFAVSFSLAVSCVMAKTIMVVIAFRATKPNSNFRRWLSSRTSYTIILSCTTIELSLAVIWLATSPPFPELNNSAVNVNIEAACNEGSILMFYCMLVFLGLLACISFWIAFLARNLPDNFNEAKFITFSMLVFVSVWLSFIPAYLSTKGKYLVAVEIFAILSSGAGLLFCIFAPKIYIIFLRPEMNSREFLMKTSSMHNKTK